jgi:dTDP-glucose pyrophosphorylase
MASSNLTGGRALSIEEKPQHPVELGSDRLYFYDGRAAELANKSVHRQGRAEITALN